MSAAPDPAFWRARRVLLTGHTGFKGAWLALWLARLGAKVTGVALAPAAGGVFEAARVADGLERHHLLDIREAQGLARAVRDAEPEVVLHLAAQALVRASYREPLATHAVNVMGTAHLLDALRGLPSVRVALVVTTDKVYANLERPWPYREDDGLGGHDPYSASKAAAEIVTASYREAFLAAQGVAVATARAGNVIGGGDVSEDRLVPDAVRAWRAGEVLRVRRPQAVRPWQHVLDPLSGYLRLAEALWRDAKLAGAYNFGPRPDEAASVSRVLEIAASQWPGARWRVEGDGGPHEAGWLALETAKARGVLGAVARWPLEDAVRRTVRWYRAQADAGADARALCEADLADHMAAA